MWHRRWVGAWEVIFRLAHGVSNYTIVHTYTAELSCALCRLHFDRVRLNNTTKYHIKEGERASAQPLGVVSKISESRYILTFLGLFFGFWEDVKANKTTLQSCRTYLWVVVMASQIHQCYNGMEKSYRRAEWPCFGHRRGASRLI